MGDADGDQVEREGLRTATYEEQMELLQRQLFRLSAERAKAAEAEKSDSEPESDDEEAWSSGSSNAGEDDARKTEGEADAPRQKGILVHFQNRCAGGSLVLGESHSRKAATRRLFNAGAHCCLLLSVSQRRAVAVRLPRYFALARCVLTPDVSPGWQGRNSRRPAPPHSLCTRSLFSNTRSALDQVWV